MDKKGDQLTIKDLESIKTIVETKVKELRLVDKSKGPKQTPEQEHKQVQRVIGDMIQIMLGYVGEASDAVPLFQSVFGTDIVLQGKKDDATDPARA
jgi:hypothetical protein